MNLKGVRAIIMHDEERWADRKVSAKNEIWDWRNLWTEPIQYIGRSKESRDKVKRQINR